MVRKKKLNPSGAKDENGQYNNAQINLHRDEIEAAGLEIGGEVFVRVRDGMIVVQQAGEGEEIQHDFGGE